jgi:cyclopropane fatty-acyl-phospholipid synthase-like methyltransferase
MNLWRLAMLRRLTFALFAVILIAVPAFAQDDNCPQKDVIFVPTPQEVVDEMLKVANVTGRDVVYDLGSGDGRIPITAAKVYGARAIGIDICDIRIQEANANLKTAGVGDKVKFLKQDLFQTDISEATVVTMYLLPSLNLRLITKLNKELKPGTRIVSHAFDMSSDGVAREPRETRNVNGRTIYMWTTPILPEPTRAIQ